MLEGHPQVDLLKIHCASGSTRRLIITTGHEKILQLSLACDQYSSIGSRSEEIRKSLIDLEVAYGIDGERVVDQSESGQ